MRREGKIGEKYTSRTRPTGKCKRPRCRGCHNVPVSKSMGKSKGELKLKQSDINSNYLLHDFAVCETTKACSHSEGRHRPKVGSPASVWTSALKYYCEDYYEDSLDLSETPDVCEESLDVSETLDDVYHSDVAEPVPETLCFGTVGAVNVGGYWQQHLFSRGDITLADEWPHVGSCPVEGSQVSINVSQSVPTGHRSLPVSEESGDESDGDYFMATLSEVEAHQGARSTALGSFVSSILGRGRNKATGSENARTHPILDSTMHSDADVAVRAVLSESDESWDGVDAGDADDYEWDLMDAENDHDSGK